MGQTRAEWRAGRLEFFDDSTYERTIICAPLHFEENFIQADPVFLAAGAPAEGQRWVKKIVGAAPPTVAIVADGANGIAQCALTADIQKQSADLYMDDQRCFSLEYQPIIEFRINLAVLPTLGAELNWGFIGDWADGYDAITYSAFFTADGSGAITCEVDDNATDTTAASGITVLAAAWHVYRIDFTDLTDVRFYIDGAHVATGTTFPYAATGANAVLQPFFGCYKVGATAGLGTLQCDKVEIWSNRS
jgi:hypothetical protein